MSEVRRLQRVDAVRGACAAVVAFHHARTLFSGVDAAFAAVSPWCLQLARAVSERNTEAVVLFFVLSGFSIRLSVQGRGLDSPQELADYYRRRARRVLPLYWLSLGCAWLVAASLAPLPAAWLSPATLLGNLLFLQTAVGVPGQWFLPWAGNGPLWSLSFEVFYYAAFPWLVRGARTESARWRVVALATGLGMLVNVFAPNPLAMFCAASVTWYLGVELAERWLEPGAPAAPRGLTALCAAATVLRFGPGPARLAFHYVWVAASAVWVANGVLAWQRWAGVTTADRRPYPAIVEAGKGALLWFGSISYALYLLHVPVLRAGVALFGPGAAAAFGSLIASVLLAFAAEKWAERFRRAGAAQVAPDLAARSLS